MNEIIGKPVDRVDGFLKVTGGATYSAEFKVDNLAYGVVVQSTISSGRIKNIDTSKAEKLVGVLAVITYKNAMQLHQLAGGSSDPGSGKLGEKDLLPLQSDRIFYDGQHIAVVVANTFENAEHAATLVKVDYETAQPIIEVEQSTIYTPAKGLGGSEIQTKRGDAQKAITDAEIIINETYTTPVYHHNAMEPHATIAEWKDNIVTIYDSTQSVVGSRSSIAQMLGLQPEQVHLISEYIGGGFGSKGFTWPHSVLAPMAAKHVGRPVKIVLDRSNMFTSNGRRSKTIQKVVLGSGKNGRLLTIQHSTTAETSFVDEFVEQAGVATKMLYDSPNLEVSHSVGRINKGTPCPMRAPGEAPGTFALEVAMDELAYKLKMDPLELRLANYAEKDPQTGKPFSSKNLRECYERGAKLIGWPQRNATPGSMREGNLLVGYGMATAVYPANRTASSVKMQIFPDGHAIIFCATQDIGTGTYTILTQIAAEATGLPLDKIQCKLGDSQFPKGPNSGGSQTAASAGSAVWAAGLTLKSKVIKLAIEDKKSPLFGQTEQAVKAENGKLFVESEPSKAETYAQLIARQKLPMVQVELTTNASTKETQSQEANPAAKGAAGGADDKEDQQSAAVKQDEEVDRKKYNFHSFGAHFVKVTVDPLLGKVKVEQCVGVMDIGKVLNQKTAVNQIMGGMVFGIGMTLFEETVYDPNNGRVVTRDLEKYIVPVNADMPKFDIEFINKPDPFISPVGARGIGEIGITGISAAIANAIYHATGKRIRELPITPEKLL